MLAKKIGAPLLGLAKYIYYTIGFNMQIVKFTKHKYEFQLPKAE